MEGGRIVVVGGGIAGLATAYRVLDGARQAGREVSVTVLEASDRVNELLDEFVRESTV